MGSLGSSALIQALNAFTGVLLARSLGPGGRGELAAVLLWPGLFVTIGSLGLADGITFHTARRTAPLRYVVGTSLAYWAVQSVAVVGIGAVLLPLVLGHLGTHVVNLGWLYLAYVPFFLAVVYVMSLLQGLQRFRSFQALRVAQIVLVALALGGLAASSQLRVETAVAVYLAAYVVVASAAVTMLWRACPERPAFDRALARQIGGFAVRSHSSNVSSLLNERLDQFVISAFLAPVQLGLYVVAVTLTSLTNLVGQSISMIALPWVAGEKDPAARIAAVRRYVGLTFVSASLLTVPLVLFAPALIRLFFGHGFSSAATVTRVLLVAAVLLTSTRLVQAMLKAVGRPLDAGISEFMALGVTVVALGVLLPWLGILGAGIASLLAYAASCVWTARRAARALELASVRELVFARRNRGAVELRTKLPRRSAA